MKTLKSGIDGLDVLIDPIRSGIPNDRFWVAVTGAPGSLKTVMAILYAQQGMSDGDVIIYVNSESDHSKIITQAKRFGLLWNDAMAEKKLYFVNAHGGNSQTEGAGTSMKFIVKDGVIRTKLDHQEIVQAVIQLKQQIGHAQRVRLVIDSMSAFWEDKPAMSRKFYRYMSGVLNKWVDTAFVTVQLSVTSGLGFGFGVEHGIDGLIRVGNFLENGEGKHWIRIVKFRECNHDNMMRYMSINGNNKVVIGDPMPIQGIALNDHDAIKFQYMYQERKK